MRGYSLGQLTPRVPMRRSSKDTISRIPKRFAQAAQDSGLFLSYLRASNTTGGVIRRATSRSTKLLRILATWGRLESSLR